MDLSTYQRPALHFSGGKDSLACLYLLRDQVEGGLPVYWLNSGETCPETLETIEAVRPWIANFIEVRTDVAAWRAKHGNPTDLMPQSCTPLGLAYGLGRMPLVGRFDCCTANRMLPMHQRMLDDGVDAVVRGTKIADTGRLPADGATDTYAVLLPIKDWSHGDVFRYLQSVGAPFNRVYENFKNASTLDCVGCTAVWDDGKAAYFRAHNRGRLTEYRASLQAIRGELLRHLDALDNELQEAAD